MATADNLKEAFAGESQANRKYLAFAKKAEAEGYPQIAKLFRATAEAETEGKHPWQPQPIKNWSSARLRWKPVSPTVRRFPASSRSWWSPA